MQTDPQHEAPDEPSAVAPEAEPASASEGDAPAASEPALAPEADERVAEAEQRAREHREAALRAQAELENYRRRAAREMEQARKFALERVMNDLLDVRDSLERGVEAARAEQATIEQVVEGTELTFRMLEKLLTTHGLTVVDPLGEPFDPERHEAMSLVPTDEHAPDTVVTVVQKGFLLHDRLLRPARVLVAKASA